MNVAMTSSEAATPDAALLRSGEGEAFMTVCERHAPLLRSWLRLRVGDGEAAAELLAETLAGAWAARSRFRDPGDGSAAPWLFGIASKQVALYWRKRRVESSARERIGMVVRGYEADPVDESDERLDLLSRGAELEAALSALPAEQRELLRLRVVDELDYGTLAGRFGISEGAARTRVSRALANLRSLVLGGDRC
jgi:RNA polymerase sigma-70 factor (ECF subfamily)